MFTSRKSAPWPNELLCAPDTLHAGRDDLLLMGRDSADGDHPRRLGRVALERHVGDVEIDQIARPDDAAVGLAAMRAIFVDADLVAVTRLAAAGHLGER